MYPQDNPLVKMNQLLHNNFLLGMKQVKMIQQCNKTQKGMIHNH
jgi:hypothetical protein